MRTTQSTLVAVMAVAATLLGTGIAHGEPAEHDSDSAYVLPAETERSAALEKYLESLPHDERQDFIDNNLPAKKITEVEEIQPVDETARRSLADAEAHGLDVSPLANGCWTQRRNSWSAAAGNTLYTFYHVGGWCASGSRVTSARTVDAGGETKTPGWRYDGVLRTHSGVVYNQGRSFSQHRFVFGAGGWDIQTPTPCLRVNGLPNGRGYTDAVCGIY